jgi:hypothetical protein
MESEKKEEVKNSSTKTVVLMLLSAGITQMGNVVYNTVIDTAKINADKEIRIAEIQAKSATPKDSLNIP